MTEAPGLSKPVLPGTAGSDYERYLRTDELLFQTVHQSSELWLKLAWNEVEAAAGLVEADDLPAALRLLRRASAPAFRSSRSTRAGASSTPSTTSPSS